MEPVFTTTNTTSSLPPYDVHPAPRSGRIDVHHHFIPDCYREGESTPTLPPPPPPPPPHLTNTLLLSPPTAFEQSGGDPSGWGLPTWTLSSTSALMDSLGISTTILSLTAPGCTLLRGAAGASLARAVNECAAAIRDSSPARYGFFAALPPVLDSLDAAIEEVRYALDVLAADGVTLYTRYGQANAYLGHASLRPLWEELDRRRAVVFVHPTHAADTRLVNVKLPQPMIDYPHETTRAAVDMIMSGTRRDFPNCKVVLSHAGGSLPYLAVRAAVMLPDYGLSDMAAEEFLEQARGFYFDLALSGNEFTMGLLMKFAEEGHVLFGSDFPYAPEKTIRTHTKMLDECKLDRDAEWGITRANALALFPRLRVEA
jgi:6-methylsalicylate decarboxylase